MKKHPMSPSRYRVARWLFVTGGGLLALGVFLLLVKFVMTLAWYAAGSIAAIGLLMFLVGAMLLKR